MAIPFSQPQTFTRYTAGQYVSGEYQAGNELTITARCSIQPYRDGERRLTPREGGRWLDGFISIDSENELKTEDNDTQTLGDRVVYNGQTFEVMDVNYWPHISNISHYECYGQRIDDNTN